ncbi:hypothetical protein GW17_00053526 [Ensete ventricosum]|nr:hypothetical protein GW17_00053526 [Ensete ventricosum]
MVSSHLRFYFPYQNRFSVGYAKSDRTALVLLQPKEDNVELPHLVHSSYYVKSCALQSPFVVVDRPSFKRDVVVVRTLSKREKAMGDEKSPVPMASWERDRELLIPVAKHSAEDPDSKASSSVPAHLHSSGREVDTLLP